MKTIPFDITLVSARENPPKVVTSDGFDVTIVTLDNPQPWPVVAYYRDKGGVVHVNLWPADGSAEEEIGSTKPDLRIVAPYLFRSVYPEGYRIAFDGIDAVEVQNIGGGDLSQKVRRITKALNELADREEEQAVTPRQSLRSPKIDPLERPRIPMTADLEIQRLKNDLEWTEKGREHYKDFAEKKAKSLQTAEDIIEDLGAKIRTLESWKSGAIESARKWNLIIDFLQRHGVDGLDLRISDDIPTKLLDYLKKRAV